MTKYKHPAFEHRKAETNINISIAWDGLLADAVPKAGVPIDEQADNWEMPQDEAELFDWIKQSEDFAIGSIDQKELEIGEITNRNYTDEWFGHVITVKFSNREQWINLKTIRDLAWSYDEKMPDKMNFNSVDIEAPRISTKAGEREINLKYSGSDGSGSTQFTVNNAHSDIIVEAIFSKKLNGIEQHQEFFEEEAAGLFNSEVEFIHDEESMIFRVIDEYQEFGANRITGHQQDKFEDWMKANAGKMPEDVELLNIRFRSR